MQAAFILLGRATRFPGKFYRAIAGEPMLQREVRILRSLGFEVTAVSVDPVAVPQLAVLPDRYDRGPLGGLATILAQTDAPFFLVGGDMPFLDPRGLEGMRDRFDGRTMVPVDSAGRWQVLHAIYAGVSRASVQRLLEAGGGLRDLVEELDRYGGVQFLPAGSIDPRSFTDVDTPEKYRRVKSALDPDVC